jgi:hypothetical protein
MVLKKRIKGSDLFCVPDAYVIDMTDLEDPKLFVVENEDSMPARFLANGSSSRGLVCSEF